MSLQRIDAGALRRARAIGHEGLKRGVALGMAGIGDQALHSRARQRERIIARPGTGCHRPGHRHGIISRASGTNSRVRHRRARHADRADVQRQRRIGLVKTANSAPARRVSVKNLSAAVSSSEVQAMRGGHCSGLGDKRCHRPLDGRPQQRPHRRLDLDDDGWKLPIRGTFARQNPKPMRMDKRSHWP